MQRVLRERPSHRSFQVFEPRLELCPPPTPFGVLAEKIPPSGSYHCSTEQQDFSDPNFATRRAPSGVADLTDDMKKPLLQRFHAEHPLKPDAATPSPSLSIQFEIRLPLEIRPLMLHLYHAEMPHFHADGSLIFCCATESVIRPAHTARLSAYSSLSLSWACLVG